MTELTSRNKNELSSRYPDDASVKGNIKSLANCYEEETIEELLGNPLKSGYLLAFCESEFSAENMRFVLEIDRFHDSMTIDPTCWNSGLDWDDIDETIGIPLGDNLPEDQLKQIIEAEHLVFGQEILWPSKKVHFQSAVEHIQRIWNTYLSPKAPQQICIPSKVLVRTRHRLENLHIYGGVVFDETLIDPIKTLKKDTLPRFLASYYCKRMHTRLEALLPLPKATDLSLAYPGKIVTTFWDDCNITVDGIRHITMPDMLHDRLLYTHFLVYCKSIFSDENLFCGRAISIFKCHYKGHTTCPLPAEDVAWLVFRYFAAPGSVFEVSLSHRRRKELMQGLADPKVDMFDHIQESALQMLRVHWSNFSNTSIFEKLPTMIKEEKVKREQAEQDNLICVSTQNAGRRSTIQLLTSLFHSNKTISPSM